MWEDEGEAVLSFKDKDYTDCERKEIAQGRYIFSARRSQRI